MLVHVTADWPCTLTVAVLVAGKYTRFEIASTTRGVAVIVTDALLTPAPTVNVKACARFVAPGATDTDGATGVTVNVCELKLNVTFAVPAVLPVFA